MSTDVFNTPEKGKTTETPELKEGETFKDLYIGEGKKYANEEEALKGLHNAQEFIPRLQSELDELRKELASKSTLEDFVAKLTDEQRKLMDGNNNANGENNQHSSGVEPNNEGTKNMQGMSQEEVAQLVSQQISQSKEQDIRAQNAQLVTSKLREVWGDNYVSHLESKAATLGVGKEFLNEMAQTHPQAFFELVGATSQSAPAKSQDATPPRSQVNTAAVMDKGGSVRNKAYYTKLRKEDPNRYFSPNVQNQMDKDMQVLGENFFA